MDRDRHVLVGCYQKGQVGRTVGRRKHWSSQKKGLYRKLVITTDRNILQLRTYLLCSVFFIKENIKNNINQILSYAETKDAKGCDVMTDKTRVLTAGKQDDTHDPNI